MAKFEKYEELLIEWQQKMNLVGPSTLGDIWGRHFADSSQLMQLGHASNRSWLDIGSGAGFPGLVVAICGHTNVHLVESTTKKCRFLETVVESLELGECVTVHNCRVESMSRFQAECISARACASLGQLFEWGLPLSNRATRWLLPKGALVDQELHTARESFTFDAELIPSLTDPRGRIVVATNVRRGSK
jgi:16S rRNA (guanine527-N7)-methyltransferase